MPTTLHPRTIHTKKEVRLVLISSMVLPLLGLGMEGNL